MKLVKTIVIIVFAGSVVLYGLGAVREKGRKDETLPTLTSDREVLQIPCDYTQQQLLEGLSAYDETDGDLTGQILTGSMSRFIETGECDLTYVVFDSANQAATLTRRIRFTDYTSPRFSLSQPLVYRVGEGSYQETMSRIGAADPLDGDLTEWITQTATDVSYWRAGSYTMTLEVVNSFGDSVQQAFPIHVLSEEQQALTIELSQAILYVSQGSDVEEEELVSGVWDAQGTPVERDLVQVESSVDTHTPGTYEVHYTVRDAQGRSGETWLIVVVE